MNPPAKSLIDKTVAELAAQAECAAAEAPDALAELSAAIKNALRSEADAYMMLGVLLEGATQALLNHIPPERHPGTLSAALVLFGQRLALHGVAPDR
jgi:hypothetical protein